MPRKPSIRYFASRNAYYTQIDGRQHKLAEGPDDRVSGPTYAAALREFTKLVELSYIPETGDRSVIRAVLEMYLNYLEANRQPSTLDIARRLFRPFAREQGERPVGFLRHDDLDRFIALMRRPRPHSRFPGRKVCWGTSSVRDFLKNLKAALNWAVARNYITKNPVARYPVPNGKKRPDDCLVSDEQHARLLKTAKGGVREMLVALQATGARPGELIAAEARDWHPDQQAIVYRGDDRRREDEFRHKTAGENRDRVILFTGEALDMIRRLVKQRPTGRLFRSRGGKPWNRITLANAFRRLRGRADVPALIPYSYRHTLATRWLLAQRPIDTLAQILGNTPKTIRDSYSHLNPKAPEIRAALEDFLQTK